MGSTDLKMGVATDIFAAFGNVPVFQGEVEQLSHNGSDCYCGFDHVG